MKVFLVMIGALLANLSWSTPTSDSPSSAPSFSQETLSWLSDKRNEWSHLLGNASRRLDGFFADTDVIEKTNNSFIKLALRTKYAKHGEIDVEPLAKFRLDLPALEERLKFTIENEPIETQSLAEKSRENTADDEKISSEGTVAYLKLQLEEFQKTLEPKRWRASTSIGIDLKVPPDVFWRNKVSYRWALAADWRFIASQKVYYFHQDGWGESTNFRLQHTADDFVFRANAEAKYTHRKREMEFAQKFSFIQEINATRAINYQLGVLGSNRPNPRVTAYYTNAVYRRRLYEDWLFYEITPELLFPREDSFKANPSITFKIEIVFSSTSP